MNRTTLIACGLGLGLSAASALAADVDKGKDLYQASCAACHGANAEGNGTFPALAGKPAALVSGMFQAYEGGNIVGPMSSMMWQVAEDMTDEDVTDIAAYTETLK